MRMPSWGGVAVLALCAACAACASKPAAAPVPAETPLGSVAWGDMIGLTQGEVRARLGLKRSDAVFATQSLRLDVGKVIAETPVHDLARAPCRREPKGTIARTVFSHQATLTFVNGRLAAVNGLEPGGPPMDGAHPLRATCDLVPDPRAAAPRDKRSTTDKVVAAVRWGMMAPERTPEEQKQFERWKTISDLHLGATLPGGTAAWMKAHADAPPGADAPPSRGDAVVAIRTGGRIVLRNGLLTAIEPQDPDGSCLVRADMSLACDQKRYY